MAHAILLLMACARFAFGRALEAPGPFVAGLARPSHSRRGVLGGDHQMRPGSMGSSAPVGAVSGGVVRSAPYELGQGEYGTL